MAKDLLESAMEYASKGWKIFPVTPNQKTPLARLVPNGHKQATHDLETIERWWTEVPNANIGLHLAASNLVCIDIDTYKEECIAASSGLLEKLPYTLQQRSARGGEHLIYRCEPTQTFPGTLGTGIDVKHKGYILLAPSTFEGGTYAWMNDYKPVSVPQTLEKSSRAEAGKPERNSSALLLHNDFGSDPVDIDEALSAASRGEDWHHNVLRSVASMVARGLSDPEIHSKTICVTTDGYSAQDTLIDVQKMIDSARTKGFGLRGTDLSALRTASDPLKCNHRNVLGLLCEHPSWERVFGFNSFSRKRMVFRPLPFEINKTGCTFPRQLQDSDISIVCVWLNEMGMKNVQKQTVVDAIHLACEANSYNPVQDYLNACKTEHPADSDLLSSWMETYLGVTPADDRQRAYIRKVSRIFIIQAVARARTPGCKVDNVVIFEGLQGTGKSSAIAAIFSREYFGDQLPNPTSKDAASYLQGKWGIELGEMAFLRKSEVEIVKAFVTRTHEVYRPAYGREEVVEPRACVFVGTSNRSDYLHDETGNRRFLPIKTGKIDLEGIKAIRDRLWAAGAHAFDSGEAYWLTGVDAAYAMEEADQRQETDVWVEIIREELTSVSETTVKDAIDRCFGNGSAERMTAQDQRRFSRCLILAGWERDGRYTSGAKRNQVRFVNKDRTDPSDGSPLAF